MFSLRQVHRLLSRSANRSSLISPELRSPWVRRLEGEDPLLDRRHEDDGQSRPCWNFGTKLGGSPIVVTVFGESIFSLPPSYTLPSNLDVYRRSRGDRQTAGKGPGHRGTKVRQRLPNPLPSSGTLSTRAASPGRTDRHGNIEPWGDNFHYTPWVAKLTGNLTHPYAVYS